jgi:FkbM family methyltransferase
MKEKIFSLSYKIVSLLSLPWETERKISNFANLLYLAFKEGGKYTLRCKSYFYCSSNFAENYLFKKDLDEKIANLKMDLDADSQNLIDKIIKRQKYIFTHNLLDNRLIFDSDELREQKLVHSFYNKKNTYSGICPLPESFYYHNGLKYLPEDVLVKIRGKDVIDGGAFIGDSAVIFSKEYSFNNIYSFEPDRLNYIKLKENIAKYNMKNVIPIIKGISSKEEKLNFEVQGLASLISPGGSEEIEVTTVDKFAESNGPGINIGLIKFDIEGSEFNGISGSLNTIKKFRPVLLISIYHTGKDFFEIKPLLESLNLGYKFIIKKINPNDPAREIMLIAYVNNMIP